MFAIGREQTKPIAQLLGKTAHQRHAEREDRMEIDQNEILFVTREAALVEHVEKRATALSHFFPRVFPTEHWVISQVVLEIERAQKDVRRLALPIGSCCQIAGLRENNCIDGFTPDYDPTFRATGLDGEDKVGAGAK
jgi:Asp-tRNA(Asn)/Glu-tRNA(Gln) amidotransferase B subunit